MTVSIINMISKINSIFPNVLTIETMVEILLAAWWLRFHASTARGVDLLSDWGAKILDAVQYS